MARDSLEPQATTCNKAQLHRAYGTGLTVVRRSALRYCADEGYVKLNGTM
ncbi:hypothetical protein QWZ13_18060 [Reinekea marina]|nr:hypothetical protein [Reinekea marina]MDN3650815.1 hypothetical protein [Reinekea marina]